MSTQAVCSPQCALALVKYRARQAHKRETRDLRSKFNKNDRKYQTDRAVRSCHEFIRLRDFELACISCGIRTGQMTAGHFKTGAHQPGLRFHPWNINKQCGQCNFHKSGNVAEYRPKLVEKIGLSAVEYLERDHPVMKVTLEELDCITRWYKIRTCLLSGKKMSQRQIDWLKS